MKTTYWTVLALLVFATGIVNADIYKEDFETDPVWSGYKKHTDVPNTWSVENGEYVLSYPEYAKSKAIAPGLWFVNGSISFTARATAAHKTDSGSFGVFIKYNGLRHQIYLTFGVDKSIKLFAYEDDRDQEQVLADFVPEIGRKYKIDVKLENNLLSVSVDGKPVTEKPVELSVMADKRGRVGFYTESPATFDDLVVDGWEPDPNALPRPVTGKSNLSLEFSSYRADPSGKGEAFSVNGTLHAYIRNNGDGVAVLDKVFFRGKDAQKLIEKGLVSWYRLKPYFIKPGEVGEFIMRINGFSWGQVKAMMKDPEYISFSELKIVPTTGKPLTASVPTSRKNEPLQINFIGFSENLKTVYAYVQNNRQRYENSEETFTIAQVMVNGHDVTTSTKSGSKLIDDEVVPLEITLDKPLHKGRETVVTIATEEGVSCGHALRATPSEMVISAPMFFLTRIKSEEEASLDMYNHCMTSSMWIKSDVTKKTGLMDVFMAGRENMYAYKYLYFQDSWHPKTQGAWFDEVDKESLQNMFEKFSDVDQFYARDGSSYAPMAANVMRPWSVVGKSYVLLADGSMHAYGLAGGPLSGSNGHDFPLMKSLDWREYRVGRNIFWPYYRNAGINLYANKEDSTTTPHDISQRVISPAEQEIVLYGNLMLGAKGFFHWGYASEYDPDHAAYTDGIGGMRIGLGGIPYLSETVHGGYKIDKKIQDDTKKAWDTIGRVNAELQTIGPYVARSDVSYLARIIDVKPEIAPTGQPAAQASALVSGLDTIVLIVLNLNIDTNWDIRDVNGYKGYDTVNVTAGVKQPEWLKDRKLDVFSVDYTAGIKTENYSTNNGEYQFSFNKMGSHKIIVITTDENVRKEMTSTIKEMQSRLSNIAPLQ
jgi:hypothetical protein